ncbi:hypothetical protein N0V82_007025 [Gnomoniopsis sp. IMI 355080]|nr:hypothetical protein N0V82_007025 [Gnomoniopsis sp. IMI 355080]
MPTTRKSARGGAARGAALGKQSTLSFSNRVSKAGAVKATAKDRDVELDSPIPTPPPSKKVKLEGPEKIEQPAEEQVEDQSHIVDAGEQPQIEEAETKTPAEVRAERISDAQIRKYWKGVEEARIAKRVHQEDLGLGEKVLRYFDISSQYGPCIGIPRMKRWYRADKMGLEPPIEVLAVLLKEKSGNTDIETSAMDRLMSSTAIGSL